MIHPGGTSALPGVQRTTGSILHPGGGGAQIGIPGIPILGPRGQNSNTPRRNNGAVYAYPVYVGGYGYADPSYYDQQPQAPPQQPNVVVVYPQQQQANPVIINVPPAESRYAPPAPRPQQLEPEAAAPSHESASHYLLALKDHSIYSAVAYWVEGDTLHYFTTGTDHHQVAVSQVDRDLTKRLNEDSGLDIKLPAAK